MKGFVIVLAIVLVPPPQMRPQLPPESLPLEEATPATALDQAFKKLQQACPDRLHANESPFDEEGSRFCYRPHDLYDDCADEIDALVKTKEPIDERLLEVGNKAKELPERYRVAWILIQRRNAKVVPIVEKMADSSSAEERYLAWRAYTNGIRQRQLPVPQSFDATLDHCRKEKNRFVQAQIIDFLGACKAKQAVPLLTAALEDDRHYSAAAALGEIRDPKTVPAILARAKKETLNRHVYFHVLGSIGTSEAVDYLLQNLDESCFAVEALFKSGSPKALPAIEKHLDRLKKKEKVDELHLATAQIAELRLKYEDPREQLVALVEDRKQSQWMRTHALDGLGHYDKKPFADRILKLYRTDTDDWMRMLYIRFLRDLPGKDITEAMIDHALTDKKDEYYHSHYDLVEALNQRLNTSFRTDKALVEYLQRERDAKEK
jgi:HEAT repeat protein